MAIIEKGMEENPGYAGFLHAYFFDICFAPIEPNRLTFALGHAWTMAQVADRHLAATSMCATDATSESGVEPEGDAETPPLNGRSTLRARGRFRIFPL